MLYRLQQRNVTREPCRMLEQAFSSYMANDNLLSLLCFYFRSRYKFMLETLTNIKNNKIKQQQANVGDKEMVLKMKKFLSGLAKKRSVHSTEALRVSLDDIHNIETKGKWWLIGSSWKDNLVGTESKYASKEVAEDLKKDASLQQALLKLARQQGMNTDIRRSIFVVLMSSEVLFLLLFFGSLTWIVPLFLCMDAHCLGTCKIGLRGCL